MGKSSGNRFLEFFIDKKFYKETWYYYLTGDWHMPFPDELKNARTFINLHTDFTRSFPATFTAMNVVFQLMDSGEMSGDSWVPRLPVSAPGYAVHVKDPRVNMKSARKWN